MLQADGANGNQQIWAIDPAVLQRSGSIKEVGKGAYEFILLKALNLVLISQFVINNNKFYQVFF